MKLLNLKLITVICVVWRSCLCSLADDLPFVPIPFDLLGVLDGDLKGKLQFLTNGVSGVDALYHGQMVALVRCRKTRDFEEGFSFNFDRRTVLSYWRVDQELRRELIREMQDPSNYGDISGIKEQDGGAVWKDEFVLEISNGQNFVRATFDHTLRYCVFRTSDGHISDPWVVSGRIREIVRKSFASAEGKWLQVGREEPDKQQSGEQPATNPAHSKRSIAGH